LLLEQPRTTRDVDIVGVNPDELRLVHRLSRVVAEEEGLGGDWLNDGAKGYVHGRSEGPILLEAPGVVESTLSLPQLLAMKLSAWRDDVDISDASGLLDLIASQGADPWTLAEPFILPGRELKAKYAYQDLKEFRE